MVDAILVSNSHSLALLPYITELKGFRGKVLSTEPVVRLGKYVVFITYQHFSRVIIEDLFKEMENLSSDAIAQAKQKRFEVKIIFKRYSVRPGGCYNTPGNKRQHRCRKSKPLPITNLWLVWPKFVKIV